MAETYSRFGSHVRPVPSARRTSAYNRLRASARWPGVGTSSPSSGQ